LTGLRQSIVIFISLCMLVEAAAFPQTEISSLENPQLSQCGINSLYLCLKYHGTDIPLEDLYARIQPDSQNNVSLKQLGDYAREKGLYVKFIREPTAQTIQKALQRNNSIVLQFQIPLPDHSVYKHMAGLIQSDASILLLDYPNPQRKLSLPELTNMAAHSEGILVLSSQAALNLHSAGYWMMGSGLLGMTVLGFSFVLKRRRPQRTGD